MVDGTYWKGTGIFLQSNFSSLLPFPCWLCPRLGLPRRQCMERELEVLASTLRIHTVISDYMYTLGKLSHSPSHLCSTLFAICTHWGQWGERVMWLEYDKVNSHPSFLCFFHSSVPHRSFVWDPGKRPDPFCLKTQARLISLLLCRCCCTNGYIDCSGHFK